ncbi:hypothetical protein [Arsenophonus endosymbiont of Bemisia tabaci]|uniref:hypothetical protein n=1 Tax=Arsenophonus endosymbiont of Bemisia tabaci TaxID=536059 RepID=UPI001EE3344B|nr:hypothetical protein [Arsenophonus endosymbiont of Bemisia tabaci]
MHHRKKSTQYHGERDRKAYGKLHAPALVLVFPMATAQQIIIRKIAGIIFAKSRREKVSVVFIEKSQ